MTPGERGENVSTRAGGARWHAGLPWQAGAGPPPRRAGPFALNCQASSGLRRPDDRPGSHAPAPGSPVISAATAAEMTTSLRPSCGAAARRPYTHNRHDKYPYGHLMYLVSRVAAGETGHVRETAARHRPAVPGARSKDRVPGAALCGSLPTCQARDPRRARSGGLAGPIRGGPQAARPRRRSRWKRAERYLTRRQLAGPGGFVNN
jgi:hypothetical protein